MRCPEAAEFYGTGSVLRVDRDIAVAIWALEAGPARFQCATLSPELGASAGPGSPASFLLTIDVGEARHADGEAPSLTVVLTAGPGNDADYVEVVGRYLGMAHRGGTFHVILSQVPVLIFADSLQDLRLPTALPEQTIALRGHLTLADIIV